MKTRLQHATIAALFLTFHVSALPYQQPCYRDSIPAPPVRRQTILLVDLTTARATDVIESFRKIAIATAKDPGQRFVILSFAGIAPEERLSQHLNGIVQAEIVDPEVVDDLPMMAFRESQACVKKARKAWPVQVQVSLAKVFAGGASDRFQRSEIVYALAVTLRSLATPDLATRLLVYSDGLQFGSGLSFYGGDKRPRTIDAAAELAKLGEDRLSPPGQSMGPFKVLWWGLMVEEAGPIGKPYYDSKTIEQLRQFWSRLLLGWGASSVQIEPSLVNPQLGWQEERPTPSATGDASDRGPSPRCLVETTMLGRKLCATRRSTD